MMNRVNGAQGVRLIECTNPVKDKWRVRWDVHNNEDGSADYMEAEFHGRPSDDTIKAMVSQWFNDRTIEAIRSGFAWHERVALGRESVQLQGSIRLGSIVRRQDIASHVQVRNER